MFTLSSHWLLVIFIFVVIGGCDYFGFGFTTLKKLEKHSMIQVFAGQSLDSYVGSVNRTTPCAFP